MALFAVTYTYAEGSDARRDEVRPTHRQWLGALAESGSLVASGPWGADEPAGALLVVKGDDKASVTATVAEDPFQQAGLVAAVQVAEWVVVSGYAAGAF